MTKANGDLILMTVSEILWKKIKLFCLYHLFLNPKAKKLYFVFNKCNKMSSYERVLCICAGVSVRNLNSHTLYVHVDQWFKQLSVLILVLGFRDKFVFLPEPVSVGFVDMAIVSRHWHLILGAVLPHFVIRHSLRQITDTPQSLKNNPLISW